MLKAIANVALSLLPVKSLNNTKLVLGAVTSSALSLTARKQSTKPVLTTVASVALSLTASEQSKKNLC